MTILVDATHLRATLTGLERITVDLFGAAALAPLPVETVTAGSLKAMVASQQVGLPLRLWRDRSAVLLCPGFPPAATLFPFRGRVVPYVHDTFLMTRWGDLNGRAKAYMAAPFRLAVRTYPHFLVNSETTRDALRALCRPDAVIQLYRPEVGNVFGVTPRLDRRLDPGALRLVALGTVEPRKNYSAAAALVSALREMGTAATLTVVGRRGWGADWDALERTPGVTLLGYATPEQVRDVLATADAFLSTSHEEGLGLPLLEAQHAGLPVIAADIPVFREVLGDSGLLYDTARPATAVGPLLARMADPDWPVAAARSAAANLARWNKGATADRSAVIAGLEALVARTTRAA